MRALILSIIIGGILFPQSLLGQFSQDVAVEKFNNFHVSFPHEKIYLDYDQDAYLLGEKLWFSVYLVNAINHLPSSPSSLVYVELVGPDDRIQAARNINIVEGKGEGDFELTQDWQPGTYILRAYTQYMRNYDEAFFFQEKVEIWDAFEFVNKDSIENKAIDLPKEDNDFTVQFFPEGGDLAMGIPSAIAFKAVDQTGRGIEIEGKVIDEAGNPIAPLKTLKFGLGSFKIQPKRRTKYRAEVTYNGQKKTFDLPEAKSMGYVIQADATNRDELIMTIQTNIPNGLNGGVLFCHIRGQIFGAVNGMSGEAAKLRLPFTDIPDGVAHFTFFNAMGAPVAERLSFINHPENYPQLELKTLFPSYQNRQKVKLNLDLKSKSGEPLPANLSVSITDQLQNLGEDSERNIRSYILLSSDLKGRIENPEYYFTKDSPGKRALMDLLMMTQGWRRFKWNDVLEVGNPDISFPNEKGFAFEGTITKLGNAEKTIASDVSLTVFNESMQMNETTTNESGAFYFTGYQFNDTTDIVIQANLHKAKKKKKKENGLGPGGNRNVDINIKKYGRPAVNRNLFLGNLNPVKNNPFEALDEDEDWKNILQIEYERFQEYSLEEVVIKGKKTAPIIDRFDRPDVIYKRPSDRIIMDSIPGNVLTTSVFELIRGRVAGIELVGTPGVNQTIRIRGYNSIQGNTTALILVDGVPVDAARANTLNPNRVDFIDVVKGLSATAIYGAQGSNGIVAIYTRTQGIDPKFVKKNGVINISHPGYFQAREFYMPTYDTVRPEHGNPDYRITLYWNPKVEIGEDGKAVLEFYTADRATIYEVNVEGLTKEGEPVIGKMTFEVGN